MSVQSVVRFATGPSALAGAMLGVTLAGATPGGIGAAGLVPGWLYGIVVGALVRAFRVPRGAYPLAGLLAGPLPFAMLQGRAASEADRAAIWSANVARLLALTASHSFSSFLTWSSPQ